MDATGDDMSKVLSEAVEAHLTQSDDLRHEIAASMTTRKLQKTAVHHHVPYPNPHMTLQTAPPLFIQHHQPNDRDINFGRELSRPDDMLYGRNEAKLIRDERHVLHTPRPLLEQNDFYPPRDIERYDVYPSMQKREWNNRPPRHFERSDYFNDRMPYPKEEMQYPRPGQTDFILQPPAPPSRTHAPGLQEWPQSSVSRRQMMPGSPPTHHKSQVRPKPLLHTSNQPRLKVKPSRRTSRRQLSRVDVETDSEKESFDDILQEHKRNQLDKQHIGVPFHSTVEDNSMFRAPDQLCHIPPREYSHAGPHHDSQRPVQLPGRADGAFSPPASQIRHPHEHGTLLEIVPKNLNNDDSLPLDESKRPEATVLMQQERELDEYHQHDSRLNIASNDVEDEEDDEELLTLRLAALSSAYNRNIDIANEDSSTGGDNMDEYLQEELESKPKKKKSKQAKEKKKSGRKEGKSGNVKKPLRSGNEKPAEPQTLAGSDHAFLTRNLRSPEVDYTNPKILSLGNEMHKQKSMQEQGQLREIRSLNDAEEGSKRFMDLIKSKNDRELKLKKRTDGEGEVNNQDNYEEVEMDTDDSVKSSTIIIEKVEEKDDAEAVNDDVESSQPPPPGVDESDDATLPHCQESVWELLEKPLETSTTPPVSEPPSLPLHPPASFTPTLATPAEQLISSIRATLDVQNSTNKITLPPVEQLPEPVGFSSGEINAMAAPATSGTPPPTTRDNSYDAVNTDSTTGFEPAFDETITGTSFADMGTDGGVAGSDPKIDVDAPLEVEKLQRDHTEGEQDSAADVKSKLDSLDDEDALRETLLRDLAARRAKEATGSVQNPKSSQVNSAVSSSDVAPSDGYSAEKIVDSNPAARTVALTKKKGKKNKRNYQRYKRYLNKRRKKKKRELVMQLAAQKQQLLAETWLQSQSGGGVGSQQISNAVLSKSNGIQEGMSEICNQLPTIAATTASVAISQSQTSHPHTLKTKFPPPTTVPGRADAQLASTTSQPCVVDTTPSSDEKLQSVIDNLISEGRNSSKQTQHVRSNTEVARSKPHVVQSLPAQSQLAMYTQPIGAKSNAMRLPRIHPPVVVNFDPSSDEDDHVTSTQAIRIDHRAKVMTLKADVAASNMVKSASSPSLLQHSSPSRKRRSEDEPQLMVKRTVVSRNIVGHPPHNQAGIEVAVVQNHTESLRRDLTEVEGKLEKVRLLLGQNHNKLQRLQQKQKSKQEELLDLNKRSALLKTELEKVQSAIIAGNQVVEEVKSDVVNVTTTMEKRSLLESRFLHQIQQLRKKIADEAVSVAADKPQVNSSIGRKTQIDGVTTQPTAISNDPHPSKDTAPKLDTPHSNYGVDSHVAVPSNPSFVSDLKPVKTGKNRLKNDVIEVRSEKAKAIEGIQSLSEKKRNLRLQKEKFQLRKTEVKLLLIKRKAKQALKAKKLKKSLDQSLYEKYTKKRRSSLNQSQTKPVKSHRNSLTRTKSSSGPLPSTPADSSSSRKKSKRRVSIGPSTEVIPQDGSDLGTSVSSHARQCKEGDQSTNSTPVTPTLKRTHSNRKSSTSSVTTPTTTGNTDWISKDEVDLPTLPADDVIKLRRKLTDLLLPGSLNHSFGRSSSFLSLIDMYPTSTCFANWLVDASEMMRQKSHGSLPAPSSHSSSPEDVTYTSALKNFRSYRLSPGFLKQGKSQLSSTSHCHKINCDKILCRYDLTGKCLDVECKQQHLKDIVPSDSEIYLDLLWYCPELLKTNDGKQIVITDPLELQLKAAEDTVDRLCKSEKKERTVEETCRQLVAIINRAFGNKKSIASVLGRKRWKMCPHPDDDTDDLASRPDPGGVSLNLPPGENQTATDIDDRYYEDDDRVQSVERLGKVLKTDPTNEQARIQLAQAHFDQSKTEDRQKKEGSVELALHTLCIGIELNDQSEALWCTYIPILRQHYEETPTKLLEQVEILDQALLLMPLSRAVWNEMFKWSWSLERLETCYQQLAYNLLTRDELLKEMKLPIDHQHSYYSSWLLLTITEHCHLLLHARGVDDAISLLSATLKNLRHPESPQMEGQVDKLLWPLCQVDAVKLWLIYIHLLVYGALPPRLYNHDKSTHIFGMTYGFDDVTISFSSRPIKLRSKATRELFKDAFHSTTDSSASDLMNGKRQFALYRCLINYEVEMKCWEKVSALCKELVEKFAADSYTDAASPSLVDVWVTWAEAVMRSNDVVSITKVFDRAITSCPQSVRLAYMAALYQLNSDSTDVEAALSYLEGCVDSTLDLQGLEGLSASELLQLYRRILRHDSTIRTSSQLVFKSSASPKLLEKEKPYLWLVYCMLTELVQSQDDGSPQQVEIADLFEAALHIMPSSDDRQIVWIQYLLHLRSNALNPSPDQEMSKKAKLLLRRDQLSWFRRFTSVVRRCLATTPCKLNAKLSTSSGFNELVEKTTDYTFHNEVSSIFLDCFSSDQRSIAFTILTDAMPTNIPLLERAASFFLSKGDHISAVSLLWRITSAYSVDSSALCKNPQLWKMVGAGLVANGKHRKAIRLYNRALASLPRSKEMWNDAAALTIAYGNTDDLLKLNERCKAMLADDVSSLTKELVSSL